MKKSIIGAVSAVGIIAAVTACGSTTTVIHDSAQVVKSVPVAAKTTVPAQIIINNNNNPVPVYVAPAPVYTQPVYRSDPYSVVSQYMNDVSSPGGNPAAWGLLGPVVQAGWNSNYNTFVAWADPTSFSNISEVSESGDTVTVTYNLSNSAGDNVPYTATFTVDSGIITSDSYSQNAASSTPGLNACGTGTQGEEVYANADTSCPFALVIEQDYAQGGYWNQPGTSQFYAYSPVTNQSYFMTSSSVGNPVTVTGGTNILVQFNY